MDIYGHYSETRYTFSDLDTTEGEGKIFTKRFAVVVSEIL